MSWPAIGALMGVLVSIAVPMIWVEGAGGGALLVPLIAAVLAPIGWVLGWLAQKLLARPGV